MLNLEIDFLNHDFVHGTAFKPILELWDNDFIYLENGQHKRVIPINKLISLAKPGLVIKCTDKIFEPLEEALDFRRYISNRRLKLGRYSIYELMQVDLDYFNKHLILVEQASIVIDDYQDYIHNKEILRGIWFKLNDLFKSPIKYEFEGYVRELLKQILLDTPKFKYAYPCKYNPDKYYMYNSELYRLSHELYSSFAQYFVYEKPEEKVRGVSFWGEILRQFDEDRKKKTIIKNKWISYEEFEKAIRVDLDDYIKIFT